MLNSLLLLLLCLTTEVAATQTKTACAVYKNSFCAIAEELGAATQTKTACAVYKNSYDMPVQILCFLLILSVFWVILIMGKDALI